MLVESHRMVRVCHSRHSDEAGPVTDVVYFRAADCLRSTVTVFNNSEASMIFQGRRDSRLAITTYTVQVS